MAAAPNRGAADALLDKANTHLQSAAALAATDVELACDALHAANRKALTAFLLVQGLRPTRDAGHTGGYEAVRAQAPPTARSDTRALHADPQGEERRRLPRGTAGDGDSHVQEDICTSCGKHYPLVTSFLTGDSMAYAIAKTALDNPDGHEAWIDLVAAAGVEALAPHIDANASTIGIRPGWKQSDDHSTDSPNCLARAGRAGCRSGTRTPRRPLEPEAKSAGWRRSPRCARRPASDTSRPSTPGCATGGPAPRSPASSGSTPRP